MASWPVSAYLIHQTLSLESCENSRDEAFVTGDEIAKAVTDINPRLIKLNLEKPYHRRVLLVKKIRKQDPTLTPKA